ncbi:heme-binding protein [Glacieibacterium megasporae]|uniref:heme-binding protein n=1 Tax=Glacieibacterium megasporae TaxID=2835787 RepID=UPI001C1DE1D3|nr:heme-binding protein [Polymorphobacter megasporae]UAJ10517.1 heme-binding protein [Polymorphobacter megasporae]
MNWLSDAVLSDARESLGRAMGKAAAFRQAGAFIVVDTSGTPVCAVRMDGAPAGALPLVRAKAFATAVNGEPSAQFASRMAKFHAGIFSTYQRVLRDNPFPGAGGVPLRRNGVVTGAIATGLGIGPFNKLPSVDPTSFLIDGVPGNLEDIVISYAVGGSYSPQHGDDLTRWIESYGEAPIAGSRGSGLDEVPPAGSQPVLDKATRLSDIVLEHAHAQGLPIAVAVVDRFGDPIRIDRMSGCPPMAVDVAVQTAAAAVNFQMPSDEIVETFPQEGQLARLLSTVPFRLLAMPGAAPLREAGSITAAVGVAGCSPQIGQRLANEAISALKE